MSHRRSPKLLISMKYMEMLSNVRIVERSEKFVQFSEHIKQKRSKFDEGLSNVQKIVEHRQ